MTEREVFRCDDCDMKCELSFNLYIKDAPINCDDDCLKILLHKPKWCSK